MNLTRYELIKAIAEAYDKYYLCEDPTGQPVHIIYNQYGCYATPISKNDLNLDNNEYVITTLTPDCFGEAVENKEDLYTWFIDYALRDIDDMIDGLKDQQKERRSNEPY